jgi:hypothetical protein
MIWMMHLQRRTEFVNIGLEFNDSEVLWYYLTDSEGRVLSEPHNARCWGQVAFHLEQYFRVPPHRLAEGRQRLAEGNAAVIEMGESDPREIAPFDLIETDS